MFGEHDTNVLGIVENMASYTCPDCESMHDIFGEGGWQVFAANNDLPFFKSLPLDPQIRTVSDDGDPAVLGSGATADAFNPMTANIADMVGVTQWDDVMNRWYSLSRMTKWCYQN
jgi:ATP-binding protein involved in chromosome partitioning